MPDYTMVVVGSNMGVLRMTKEHLGVALALKYPLIFAVRGPACLLLPDSPGARRASTGPAEAVDCARSPEPGALGMATGGGEELKPAEG